MSGGDDSINFAGWSAAHPFNVIEGVTLRHIGEMTDPPQAYGISPLGASAHFFSTHYKDQTSLWLSGRTPPSATVVTTSPFGRFRFLLPGSAGS